MKLHGSWKTTLAGVGGALGGAAALIAAVTADTVDPNAVLAALAIIATSIGNMFARDNGVTSEDAGAKK